MTTRVTLVTEDELEALGFIVTTRPLTTADDGATLAGGDIALVDVTDGPAAFDLPAPTDKTQIRIKKINDVTPETLTAIVINPTGGALIDGESELIITVQWQSELLIADGTNWGRH